MFQGILLVLFLATVSTFIANIKEIQNLGFSPLVVGIVLGMVYANLYCWSNVYLVINWWLFYN